MPRGDKSSYTNKQKRQAEHIEEGYENRGVSRREAERRAWATVNKETGGGKKTGSGRGKKVASTRRRRAAGSSRSITRSRSTSTRSRSGGSRRKSSRR
jgi:plasmid stabilization system protein ParE